MRFVRGSVKHDDGTTFNGVYPEVVEENENAALYTLRKNLAGG